MSLDTLRRLAHRPARRGASHLAEAIPGRAHRTVLGDFYLIEERIAGLSLPRGANALHERLRLVPGIGPRTEARLRAEGLASIEDLAALPRYARPAGSVLAALASRDHRAIAGRAPDVAFLGQYAPHEVAVVDIETTGLRFTPLFLVGVLSYEAGGAVVRQYLARSYAEEAAALWQAVCDLEAFPCVVTFNGRAFDLPYIEARLVANNLTRRWDGLHVDVLPHARRRLRGLAPNCRLATIERHFLDAPRGEDIEGWMIPRHYHAFVRTGDPAYLEPIVRHNAADLIAVSRLLHLLAE